MRLIKVQIENFRILKKLVLDFSLDASRNLTVIRAANESGKTTCKTAILWGLFGDKALPQKGKKFPLVPSDLADSENRVEVVVEIEFESEQPMAMGKGVYELKKNRYRIRRSCYESAPQESNVRRMSDSRDVYEVTPKGSKKISDHEEADRVIENSMPFALKDVYITDGDAALSFIETGVSLGVKRKRVGLAIEALLGLDILKTTKTHIANVAKRFSSEVKDQDYRAQLEKLNDAITSCEEDIEEWSEEKENLDADIQSHEDNLRSVGEKIDALLRLGDKSKLVEEINGAKRDISKNEQAAARALNDISGLLKDSNLSAAMLIKQAEAGKELLNTLSEKKQLPKVNVPILEELLDRSKCFCGEDLARSSKTGQDRRASIKKSIEESRKADKIQEAASSLFYAVRSEQFNAERGVEWVERYKKRNMDYSECTAAISRKERELKRLEAEKDKIDDTDLERLRDFQKTLTSKMNQAVRAQGGLESQIKEANERLVDKKKNRGDVEKKLSRTDASSDNLSLTRMVQNIFDQVIDRLLKNELGKVSDEMNRIFLGMIGSAPEDNDFTNITKAELTEDFDILVYGPKGFRLDPDDDLNGASRRAITLAFILALTKVSKVEAPNVIDTPLGMMSGYVKKSVLRSTLEEGSQVILFLTHDEINGVEDILDAKAGKTFTMTNPGHHPKMLANKPKNLNAGIVRCECDHKSHCYVCERV